MILKTKKNIISLITLLFLFIILTDVFAETYVVSPGDTITFSAKNSPESISDMEEVTLPDISYPESLVSVIESFPSTIPKGETRELIFMVNSDAEKCSEGTISFKLTHNNQSEDMGIIPKTWEKTIHIAIDCGDETLTYYGGSHHEASRYIAADNSGNFYISGWTESNDGIATPGANQTILLRSTNGFLSKFNRSGMLQWGTYYYANTTNAVTADASGFLYITGHQSYNEKNEAYIAKFNAETGQFVWEKYFGETNYTGTSLTTDNQNNIYLAGWANVGGKDAILVKFDSSGNKDWRIICGGNNAEYGHGVATDPQGNVYLVGETKSPFGPHLATTGTHQPEFGGNIDAFLSKFDSSGDQIWGTYFGGTDLERGYSVTTDTDGNVYIAGETRTSDSIAYNGHQNTFGGGTSDAFIAKFNGADGRLIWASYYGGSGSDTGKSITVDASGNIYLTGETESIDIDDYIQKNTTDADAFLAKFDSSGTRQWAAVYGGGYYDSGESIAIDSTSPTVYLLGTTNSNKNGQETDTFINIIHRLYPPIITPQPGTYNSPQTITISTGTEGANIRYTTDGTTPTALTGNIYTQPFTVAENTTVKAIIHKPGYIDSDIAEAVYEFKPDPPVINPQPGIYDSPQTITINTTYEGASVRYTTDGSIPTSSAGNIYSQPFTVSETVTVKAIAYKQDCIDSDVAEAVYTIQTPITPINNIITLVPDWQLISINITPEDMSPESVFSSILPSLIQVKSTNQSYDPKIPAEFNTLKSLQDGAGYWLKSDQNNQLQVTGIPVDVSATPVHLDSDWNLVGYLCQEQQPVTDALSGIMPVLVQVKNINQSYDPTSPGSNTLSYLEPGKGYHIKVSSPTALIYPEPAALKRFSNKMKAESRRLLNWTPVIYPANSTTAYGKVTIDGKPASEGDVVGVFAGEECRASSSVFLYNGGSYVTLVIQGETGETVNFKVYDASRDTVSDADYTIQTISGGVIGNSNSNEFIPIAVNTTIDPGIIFTSYDTNNNNQWEKIEAIAAVTDYLVYQKAERKVALGIVTGYLLGWTVEYTATQIAEQN
ncbi:MAG: hypothetical protein GY749_33005 [Desulfobacteraceae bacterium]|nr:hypothetical protein [Desulfobacteraceae bacterium]